MRLSSGTMVGVVGPIVGERGPEHVGAPAGGGDGGLGVVLPLAPLAVVVGQALRVAGASGEGTEIEAALEVAIAAAGAPEPPRNLRAYSAVSAWTTGPSGLSAGRTCSALTAP